MPKPKPKPESDSKSGSAGARKRVTLPLLRGVADSADYTRQIWLFFSKPTAGLIYKLLEAAIPDFVF